MAPRKRCRSVKAINKDYSKLTLNDALCPICRNILLEPVSLPCNHGFCLPCFEGTLANSNLNCPLCRVRFASWHRVATKENRIVDECLWLAVKKLFPELVKNRIDGVDNNIADSKPVIKLSTPGDIRKEYETERQKEIEEVEKERAVEEKASEVLINKFREEEEFERKLLEETLRRDEEMAKKLSESLNSKNSQPKSDTPKKLKPLDKFLLKGRKVAPKKHVTKILCQDKFPEYANTPNKSNSEDKKHAKNGAVNNLQKEVNLSSVYYFQPIDIVKESSHISPLKVPVKQQRTNVIKIMAPKGTIALIPNVLSAFAKVCDLSPTIGSCSPTTRKPKDEQTRKGLRKRKQHDEVANPKTEQLQRPSKVVCQRKSIRLLGLQPEDLDSPPFRGFEACKSRPDCDVPVSNNNLLVTKGEQERKDFEFAKKLQSELNQMRWYSTRNSSSVRRSGAFCKRQRQIKLDDIIKCGNKVK